MNRTLLQWLAEPSGRNGIRFAAGPDEWEFWSYRRLAGLARSAACWLTGHGVRPGEVVIIIQPSGPYFVATLFGAMLAGAVPSPVAPPMAFQDPARYDEHVRALISRSAAVAVVTSHQLADRIRAAASVTAVRRILIADELPADGDPDLAGSVLAGSVLAGSVLAGSVLAGSGQADPDQAGCRAPTDLALVQFTSGSSGVARGVRVTFGALEANCRAIRDWLRMTQADPTATWLPVHHDMGLIGCLMTPVVYGSDIWLMEPAQFVQSPVRYLRCFGSLGARLTAMPGFGLAHIARRVRPEQLHGLDFSRWRAVIVGAEPIDPAVLDGFIALLGPYGLTRKALLPAYGLAEATLAVTGLPLAEEPVSVLVTPDSCQPGRDLAVLPGPAVNADVRSLVGCGYPLTGTAVEIVSESGSPAPPGRVGEIVVRGPSVARGYLPGEDSSGSTFSGGVLRTGDAGFLHDGQLYVLGRLGDSMKLRGRSVFAEDLEAQIIRTGVPARRVVVLLGVHNGEPTAVAVVERCADAWLPTIAGVLRRMSEGARTLVIDAPRGTIERTSSGKPRRRVLWHRFTGGTLPGVSHTIGAKKKVSR